MMIKDGLSQRRSLVTYISPILLIQSCVEFAEGLMNYKICFLKISRISELYTQEFNLFPSFTEDGKT